MYCFLRKCHAQSNNVHIVILITSICNGIKQSPLNIYHHLQIFHKAQSRSKRWGSVHHLHRDIQCCNWKIQCIITVMLLTFHDTFISSKILKSKYMMFIKTRNFPVVSVYNCCISYQMQRPVSMFVSKQHLIIHS